MKLRLRAALLIVAVAAFALWRSQLFIVTRPGDHARPLRIIPSGQRARAIFAATLPAIPVGAVRLEPGGTVLVIHYWAPWERHAATQIAGLDSLARLESLAVPANGSSARIFAVCFDPFPSVARYVARQRLRVPVLLDTRRALSAALPCPSVPYTYAIDREGRIAISQPGEVDWLDPETRASLAELRESAAPAPKPGEAPISFNATVTTGPRRPR